MKFIHFGCWNNGSCDIDTGDNGLSQTMKKLNNYIESNQIDFLTIAGDNYYPDKKKVNGVKIKNMKTSDFNSGVKCLPKDIKKYVILGNHEYDNMLKDGVESHNCHLLETQQQIFSDPELNTTFFNDVISIRKENTLIIMIDTTIYEEKDSNTLVSGSCYDKVFVGIDRRDTVNDLINHQGTKVNSILTENLDTTNIILIGHHPIISVRAKEKDGRIKNKAEVIKGLQDLFVSMKDKVSDKKLFYLCADTHLYQKGTVQIDELPIINQYICGTGGADQDDCEICDLKEVSEKGLTYKIDECHKIFGFLVVSDNGENLSFEFINSSKTAESKKDKKDKKSKEGGYYEKYLKYKQKYLQLKNM